MRWVILIVGLSDQHVELALAQNINLLISHEIVYDDEGLSRFEDTKLIAQAALRDAMFPQPWKDDLHCIGVGITG